MKTNTDKEVVIAQVGCGYWGPNLLRSFSSQPGCRVKWVVETAPARRKFVENSYPRSKTTADVRQVLEDPDVEAVVVSTPAGTHFQMGRDVLKAGKHLFVEKPLALSVKEADELLELAAQNRRIIMAGHTFLYNPAVQFLKQMVDRNELGRLYYLYSHRLNLGQVRSDVNAWWNLAPHDVSILLYIRGGALPVSVTAKGMDYIQPGIEDVVFATMTWDDGFAAHVHVSWLDPGKVRQMTLVGDRKMVVYDDVADDKIRVLDKGVDKVPRIGDRMDFDRFDGFQLQHRMGDIWLPRVQFKEPLQLESAHFLDCLRTGKEPLTGGSHARDVVAVLEAANASLKSGKQVDLPRGSAPR
jgi:predicted dehydrogenase